MRKERIEHPVPAKVQSTTAKATSWIGSWVGWGGAAAADQHESDDPSTGLSEEQRKELYKAIEWDEKDAVEHAIDYPADTLMLRVKAKLETGSFALRTDPHGKATDLVALNFDDFRLDVAQRPENFEATLGLGDLRVTDGTCPGSRHPQVVRVKEVAPGTVDKFEMAPKTPPRRKRIPREEREADDDDGQDESSGDEDEDDEGEEREEASSSLAVGAWAMQQNPFFSLKFEHSPLDKRADNALAMRLRHTEIVYHRGYVEAIVAFFKPPESQLESVGALIDVASETLEGIRKETRAGLEYALAQHKTVDILLDLNAVRLLGFLGGYATALTDISLFTSTAHHHYPRRHDRRDVPTHCSRRRTHLGREQPRRSDRYRCRQSEGERGVPRGRLQAPRRPHVRQVPCQAEGCAGESSGADMRSSSSPFETDENCGQLLMGPTLRVCLDALEKPEAHSDSSLGELHILERTSLAFLAQNCILADAPNLTRLKISGSLPSLQLNVRVLYPPQRTVLRY